MTNHSVNDDKGIRELIAESLERLEAILLQLIKNSSQP
jgi:hypothetical protein